MAPPDHIVRNAPTRKRQPMPHRPQFVRKLQTLVVPSQTSPMKRRSGRASSPSPMGRRSWESEKASSSSPLGRRSPRLSHASGATSHTDEQRSQSPSANSPSKKSQRANLWARLKTWRASSSASVSRRSSRFSHASDTTSEGDEQHSLQSAVSTAKGKKGSRRADKYRFIEPDVWARLTPGRVSSSSLLGRRLSRFSRGSGATSDADESQHTQSPAATHSHEYSSVPGPPPSPVAPAPAAVKGRGRKYLQAPTPPPAVADCDEPKSAPLPRSDGDAAFKLQIDARIGPPAAAAQPLPPPPSPTIGHGPKSPVTARRTARRAGASSPYASPYASPTGRRFNAPRLRRPTPPVGGGGVLLPDIGAGRQRQKALRHFEQGRYAESAAGLARTMHQKPGAAPKETAADFRVAVQHISYWARPEHLRPQTAILPSQVQATPKRGLSEEGGDLPARLLPAGGGASKPGFASPPVDEEEEDLQAKLGLRLQAPDEAEALLDFEFAHVAPRLDLARLLSGSEAEQHADLVDTVGVLRRHFGSLKRVHEAFAARKAVRQVHGDRKARATAAAAVATPARSGLPHVLATHVMSRVEYSVLIETSGMLGGGLNRGMADVVFVRCSAAR